MTKEFTKYIEKNLIDASNYNECLNSDRSSKMSFISLKISSTRKLLKLNCPVSPENKKIEIYEKSTEQKSHRDNLGSFGFLKPNLRTIGDKTVTSQENTDPGIKDLFFTNESMKKISSNSTLRNILVYADSVLERSRKVNYVLPKNYEKNNFFSGNNSNQNTSNYKTPDNKLGFTCKNLSGLSTGNNTDLVNNCKESDTTVNKLTNENSELQKTCQKYNSLPFETNLIPSHSKTNSCNKSSNEALHMNEQTDDLRVKNLIFQDIDPLQCSEKLIVKKSLRNFNKHNQTTKKSHSSNEDKISIETNNHETLLNLLATNDFDLKAHGNSNMNWNKYIADTKNFINIYQAKEKNSSEEHTLETEYIENLSETSKKCEFNPSRQNSLFCHEEITLCDVPYSEDYNMCKITPKKLGDQFEQSSPMDPKKVLSQNKSNFSENLELVRNFSNSKKDSSFYTRETIKASNVLLESQNAPHLTEQIHSQKSIITFNKSSNEKAKSRCKNIFESIKNFDKHSTIFDDIAKYFDLKKGMKILNSHESSLNSKEFKFLNTKSLEDSETVDGVFDESKNVDS